MRGFLVGSLVLIALEVAVQPGGVKAAAAGTTWLGKALQRLLSPAVAGVPQRRTTQQQR